jgi:hypothetical protein
MKYQVGDLVLLKKCIWKPRLKARLKRGRKSCPRPGLHNTFGIITAAEKHSELFIEDSTDADNGYFWYSQVDQQEYYFYENEAECEVFK